MESRGVSEGKVMTARMQALVATSTVDLDHWDNDSIGLSKESLRLKRYRRLLFLRQKVWHIVI